ncbi:TolC family protein [Croceibacter atlanticus]|jgi:outer membrane protein|uniref:Outer membrane efflux protein, putative n=1 Tax=Croceibacter atlanticus (strain ATCC BAA-628 / JCM 21780 / CIP 108009 / IAM 15332 / KCTC 12090 / HTCC2559) TaxID=216432 RepID=A3U5G6_CROAH|nr:TolC family protein [Croceibacter atlanticus]EAP87483.1 outer membrane efflux protein, putative [Croceibacter atlanticus HTCC2559]MBW4970283.1 TolC family protein [Croceibacter atlanticus]
MTYRIVMLLLFVSSVAFSQEAPKSYSFSLEEAVNYALDSSYTAINARRDVAKALKQKWETTADGLPQINGSVDYQNQLKQPVTFIPAEFSGGEPGTFTPVTFGAKQSANLTATLSQVIFDGSYLVALKASTAFLEFSENANEKTRLEVRKGVINAYGGVLLTEESVSIVEKNIDAITDNLSETQALYEEGFAEEEDAEQLQITKLQLENQLSNTKRQADIAKQMFNLALGIPVSAPVVFKDGLEQLTLENVSLEISEQELAVEENVDYKIADNLTKQRELELKLEKSKALPSVNAFVNYGTQTQDDDFVFFDSDTRWFQSSIFGVSINVPIFSSLKRSARTQRAAIALDQAQTDLEQTIQQIQLDTDTARSDYQFAIESYQTAQKNLELAERIENKNQIKFREGISTSFDLRQAQTQLYNAQQELLQSMVNVITTKAELETVLNTPQLRVPYQESK